MMRTLLTLAAWALVGVAAEVPAPPEPMPGVRGLDVLAYESPAAAATAWRAAGSTGAADPFS